MSKDIKPKHIINTADTAVEDLIQGLLLQYPFRRVENQPVLLLDPPRKTVALLSGGGSGHEPAHAGYLGLLDAAVLGGLFASPSVANIVAALRALDRDTLMIVKNYTGDRLNFGAAAGQVPQNVRMIVVADDVSLPRKTGFQGARGVAGTVLVHKVAGAAALAGKSLDEVYEVTSKVCSCMGTLGIALDAVTVPGASSKNTRIPDDKIEVGLGIHGEAGSRQSPTLTAMEMATEMVTKIRDYGREVDGGIVPMFEDGDHLCMLVNNLGGSSNLEIAILAKYCATEIEKCGGVVTHVFCGTYMTSFSMHGASLTILNLTKAGAEVKTLLEEPCSAPAWVPCTVFEPAMGSRPSSSPVVVKEEPIEATKDTLSPCSIQDFSDLAAKMISAAANALIASEPSLTEYDTIVGDGDCGLTMKRGASAVLEKCLQQDHPVLLFESLAVAVSNTMGGTSGILYEVFFRKVASTCLAMRNIGESEMLQALRSGVEEIQQVGGASVGSRTMLDALIPASKCNSWESAANAAREGADGTKEMGSATAGRSNYLSEEVLQGTPDPGAEAVAIALAAIAKV